MAILPCSNIGGGGGGLGNIVSSVGKNLASVLAASMFSSRSNANTARLPRGAGTVEGKMVDGDLPSE